MVDDDFRAGMLLIDTPAASRKAFRADVWIVGLKNASDLSTTTCTSLEAA